MLLEPHGEITDCVDTFGALLEALGESETVGVNLDTGNSWLGGADPMDYITRFGSRIKHVHWKDMGKEWESKRGTLYGCGMGTIALGDGLIGIENLVSKLKETGFDGPTTLEVAGRENILESAKRLRTWWAGQV